MHLTDESPDTAEHCRFDKVTNEAGIEMIILSFVIWDWENVTLNLYTELALTVELDIDIVEARVAKELILIEILVLKY